MTTLSSAVALETELMLRWQYCFLCHIVSHDCEGYANFMYRSLSCNGLPQCGHVITSNLAVWSHAHTVTDSFWMVTALSTAQIGVATLEKGLAPLQRSLSSVPKVNS